MRAEIVEIPQKEAVNSQHEKREPKPPTDDAVIEILVALGLDRLKDAAYFTIQAP